MDTSTSVSGKQTRNVMATMETGTTAGGNQGKRPRGGALGLALSVDVEVAKEHPQLWNPELKRQVEARQPSVVEGVDAAASARVADECNRVLGREISPEEETQRAGLVQSAKIRGLEAWKTFGVFEPRRDHNVSKQSLQSRWVLTWNGAADRKASWRDWRQRTIRTGTFGRALWPLLDVKVSGCPIFR